MAVAGKPVRRRVALKIIKLGWTPRASSPLEAERAGFGLDGSP